MKIFVSWVVSPFLDLEESMFDGEDNICFLLCGVFLIFQDFYNFQFSFSLIWKIKIRKKILKSLIHGVYCHFQQFYRYKMHIMTTIQCILWLPIFLVSNTISMSHYVLVVPTVTGQVSLVEQELLIIPVQLSFSGILVAPRQKRCQQGSRNYIPFQCTWLKPCYEGI